MSGKEIKREVHGYMQSGERVHLGLTMLTDEEVTDFLNVLATSYRDGKSAYFTVQSAVFNAASFAGVQITPPVK